MPYENFDQLTQAFDWPSVQRCPYFFSDKSKNCYSIYELKQLLKENGAQISDIRGYTEHLSKNGASHKWVSILITGTTVLGGNVVLVAVFTDI